MKDIIKLGLTGIEGANEHFGPFVNLKGWAKNATRDMSRYDSCLEKIYKRYWRRGSVNPFMDLGLLTSDPQSSTTSGLGNRTPLRGLIRSRPPRPRPTVRWRNPNRDKACGHRPWTVGGGGLGGGLGGGFGGGGGGGASMLAA